MKKKIRSFATAVSAVESLRQILEVLHGTQIRFIEHDVEIDRKSNTDKTSTVKVEAKFFWGEFYIETYWVSAFIPLEYNGEFWLAKEQDSIEISIKEKVSFTELGNTQHYVARYDQNAVPSLPRIRVINARISKAENWIVGSDFQNRTTEPLRR